MNKSVLMACLLGAAVAPAFADYTALVVLEPTERKDGLMVSRQGLENNLAKAMGQNVKAVTSDDLTDAMRATRSKGFDVFIAPPQVVASALAHGYGLSFKDLRNVEYARYPQAGLTAITLNKWFSSSASSVGMKPVSARSDVAPYKRVAELGTFTLCRTTRRA